ncbi:MAG: hypothetical protein IT353_21380 [Gemmatimonadaceae bacterium]|nr:hypothetical protein [Gemmatimonadaceae bacterium]
MNDTRPEATAVVREAIRRISPAERMRQALELSEQLRTLSLTTLRRRHPDLSTLQLVELMTGETRVPTTAPRRADER